MKNKYSFQEIDNEIRDSYLRISQVFDERDKLRDNWNSLREENKALRLLLNWAEECDWGFDNFRDDDVIDWEEFEEESEDMDYIESMIYYAKKYLDKMNKLESGDSNDSKRDV